MRLNMSSQDRLINNSIAQITDAFRRVSNFALSSRSLYMAYFGRARKAPKGKIRSHLGSFHPFAPCKSL